jgi:hypothetical protein
MLNMEREMTQRILEVNRGSTFTSEDLEKMADQLLQEQEDRKSSLNDHGHQEKGSPNLPWEIDDVAWEVQNGLRAMVEAIENRFLYKETPYNAINLLQQMKKHFEFMHNRYERNLSKSQIVRYSRGREVGSHHGAASATINGDVNATQMSLNGNFSRDDRNGGYGTSESSSMGERESEITEVEKFLIDQMDQVDFYQMMVASCDQMLSEIGYQVPGSKNSNVRKIEDPRLIRAIEKAQQNQQKKKGGSKATRTTDDHWLK